MRSKALLTVLLAAGLAVSAALAAPPPGKGNAKAVAATAKAAPASAKGKGKGQAKQAARRAACRPNVAFVLRGDYVSGSADAEGAGSFAMVVKHANKHARPLEDRQVTVKTDAATKVRRQGKKTLADVMAGDRVNVHVRGCRSADASTMELLARQVVARAPKPNGNRATTTESTSP
jgi:hypothetical protein